MLSYMDGIALASSAVGQGRAIPMNLDPLIFSISAVASAVSVSRIKAPQREEGARPHRLQAQQWEQVLAVTHIHPRGGHP